MRKILDLARLAISSPKFGDGSSDRSGDAHEFPADLTVGGLDDPPPSASVDTLVGLHRWSIGCFEGHVLTTGLRSTEEQVTGYPATLACFELDRLVTRTAFEYVEVDIRDVSRLSNSKSPIVSIPDLDLLGSRFCKEEGFSLDLERIRTCLLHYEVRITTPWRKGTDYLCAMAWADAPLVLVNDGGSHHFAAARYIAGELSERVALRGNVHAAALSRSAVADLHESWAAFVLPDDELGWRAVRAVGAMGAVAGVTDMPRPFDALLLLVRRDGSPGARRAQAALEDAGASSFRTLTDRWLDQQGAQRGLAHELLGL